MAAYISVPRDLTKVKSKVAFNLTKRQLVCFGTAALIGVPLFFVLRDSGGNTAATLGMMAVMLPAFFLGMYEKNGQPMEKLLSYYVQSRFVRPKIRLYKTNNYYAILMKGGMETASADSMPEGVERQGIGTPATRAATIEKLVQKGFLERKGNKKTKLLIPTDKGKALITVMPEEIQSPEMTADWETKLLQIERGEMEPSEFMTEINTMITELVKNTEMKKGVSALMKSKIIGVCPNCGKPVVEREKGWFCENRECRFVLWKDNAFFKRLGKRLDAHVADKLLRDGRVRLKDCKSAKGKTYNATVLLSTEPDGRSRFSLEFEGGC